MTSPTTIDLSVPEIDAELAAVTTALANTSVLEVAVAAEGRRQELLSARRLAVVAERIRVEKEQADRAREDRARFAALEADLSLRLREQAAAVGRAFAAFSRLHAEYRAMVLELNELHAVTVPLPRREFHLAGLVDRLGSAVEECLTRRDVLQGADPAAAIEAHVAWRVQRLFNEARQQLPAVPTSDEAEESSTTEVEATW